MRSVIISPNGQYALAGAAGGTGIWYSKKSNNGFNTWTQSNINTNNWRSLDISPDGTTAIAASNSNLGIYISTLTTNVGFNNWIATNKNTENFSIVKISPDGKTALAGSNSNEGIWVSYVNFNVWAITNITNYNYFSGIYTTNSQRSILSSDDGYGIVYSSPFNGFTLSPLTIDEGVDYNGTLTSDSFTEPIYSILYQPFNNLFIRGNRVISIIPFVYYLTKRFPIIIQAVYGGYVINRQFIIEIRDVPQPPVNITLTNNRIAENATIGTLIGRLQTTDPDENDTFRYEFVDGEGSNDNNSFTISNDKLMSATTFNYQLKQTYSIRVKSTDSYGYSVQIVLQIFVIIPIANGNNLSALVNTIKRIVLRATPASNEPLEFIVLSQPIYGTLTRVSNDIYDYMPLENKIDSFQYSVKQGTMTSYPGTVIIHNFSEEDINNIPKKQGTFTFDNITFDGTTWTFGTMRTENFFILLEFNEFGNWRFYK
jgi:hypothetical protein